MRILLCNDDGYQAMGIQTLASYLGNAGHEVFIAAPSEERSGQSHAMTFFRPILTKKIPNALFPTWAVYGTPADCATIALQHILANEGIELVISGINHGLNVGWDVNYSGTVGAATEASLLGYKAIAVSVDLDKVQREPGETEVTLAHQRAFQRAAAVVVNTIANMRRLKWENFEVLNINHPGTPAKGNKVAQCGGYSMYIPNVVSWPELEKMQETPQFTNTNVYMLGGSARRNNGDSTQDVTLVQEGYVTYSFLQSRQSSSGSTSSLQDALAELC